MAFGDATSSTLTGGPEERQTPTPAEAAEGGTNGGTELGWSIGTELHASGQCKPCWYLHVGCMHGKDCNFCHALHERKSRQRPCKATRKKCKAVAALAAENNELPDEVSKGWSKGIPCENFYMRQILKRRGGSRSQGLETPTTPTASESRASETKVSL